MAGIPKWKLTDAQLVELAEKLEPAAFMALLDELSEQTKAARLLDLAITVGLKRKDIVNRRMSEVTGFRERELYKRPSRVRSDEL